VPRKGNEKLRLSPLFIRVATLPANPRTTELLKPAETLRAHLSQNATKASGRFSTCLVVLTGGL